MRRRADHNIRLMWLIMVLAFIVILATAMLFYAVVA
jgi:hypothetical protein